MSDNPRVDSIIERVTLDLMDHLDDLDKHGRAYIREYVEAIVGKPTTRRPKYRFHPKLAELVRDLAADAALTDRRTCGAAPSLITPTGSSGPVVVSQESPRRNPPKDRVRSRSANNDRPLTVRSSHGIT